MDHFTMRGSIREAKLELDNSILKDEKNNKSIFYDNSTFMISGAKSFK